MDSFLRDLRFAMRGLLRQRGFFVVTALTLALGIGATTAIFSVVNGVLVQPLPYPNAERIVQLWQIGTDGAQIQFSDANFTDVRAGSRSFAGVAEFRPAGIVSVSGATDPVRARVSAVSRDFFAVLGVQPLRGRFFSADEQRVGAQPAIIVSYSFWQARLGGRPLTGGTTLKLEDHVYTVVGVMPAAVDFPTGAELWTSRELEPEHTHRTAHNWQVIARLRDGATVEQVRAELSRIASQVRQASGEDQWFAGATAVPLREQMVGDVRFTLLLLLAASGVLLLIACANVVNLLVARVASRQGELALRLALGAGRARLVRQFFAESLVLAVTGGVVGVLLAMGGVRGLLVLDPGKLPRVGEIGVRWPVLAFALGVSVATAVALGLLTALRATRGDIREQLAQAQRTQAGTGSSAGVRGVLVVAQVAMTLVLLVGAGLLVRSFQRLLDVDPGFRAGDAVVLDLSVPQPRDSTGPRQVARFYDELIARLASIPGVREAGGVNVFPLSGQQAGDGTFLVLSSPDEPLDMTTLPRLMQNTERTGEAEYRIATPGYFRAMHIPLVAGRMFEDRDAPDAPHVALISASLAKAKWPAQDPIGRLIEFGNMDGDLRPFTVIGVVGDVRERSLASRPRPTLYAFLRQRPRAVGSYDIVLAGTARPERVIAAARAIVRAMRPDVPPRFRTADEIVTSSLADRRFVLTLIGVFGAAALLLATLGIFSVIAYLVTQRRHEIAVRVALGARSRDVVGLMLRQGVRLVLAGLIVGTLAAIALTRAMQGLLFGISPTDPIAFAVVIVALGVVALVASWVPAHRAAAVHPMEVLRGN